MTAAEEPEEPLVEDEAEPSPSVAPGPVPGAGELDAAEDTPSSGAEAFTGPGREAGDDEEETEPDPPSPSPPPPPPEAPRPPLLTPKPPQPREREPIVAPVPPRRRFRFWRTVRRLIALVLIGNLIGPPLAVLAYKVVPPPITWLMVERLFQGYGLHKRWVSLDDIDPSLPNAVIAAEDQRFCEHHGFDFEAMQAAMRANERHPNGRLRGGSTLSQQTAKNVFLWPGRDYVRKGLEAYFTVLIETLWGKRRIMEVYLNVAEWGPGTYGAEAAANRYFGEPATDIDAGEASHLAAILPSPLKWKAVNSGRYVQRRSGRIGAAARAVRRDGLASCLK